jgi:hypothetical protein
MSERAGAGCWRRLLAGLLRGWSAHDSVPDVAWSGLRTDGHGAECMTMHEECMEQLSMHDRCMFMHPDSRRPCLDRA